MTASEGGECSEVAEGSAADTEPEALCPRSRPAAVVRLLRGHFCYEELAILWLRILQDPSFLSKAGLEGWDVFLPSCAHHCLLSTSLLLGAGPAWTAGRASHACAEQSVAPLLSVLWVSPSLKPECVSLCTRTHGWHFCWKEEYKCKFTCMKLLCPHQALPVVDCKLGNIAMNADGLLVKASLRGQWSPPRGSPWRWHQPL